MDNAQSRFTGPMTVSQMCDAIGRSNSAVRRRITALRLEGETSTMPQGGRVTLFSAEQAQQIADSFVDDDDGSSDVHAEEAPVSQMQNGWTAAIDAANRLTDAQRDQIIELTAERTKLTRELSEARQRVEELMLAVSDANARVDALRGSWRWWRALLDDIPFAARVRRRWPRTPEGFENWPTLADDKANNRRSD